MDDLDYASLDSGIRDLVRLLRGANFRTTDSGDGRSKPVEHRTLNVPHVFCVVDAAHLAGECDRALALLRSRGMAAEVTWRQVSRRYAEDGTVSATCVPEYGPGFRVEGSYDPIDGIAVIAVLGTQGGEPPSALASREARNPNIACERSRDPNTSSSSFSCAQ